MLDLSSARPRSARAQARAESCTGVHRAHKHLRACCVQCKLSENRMTAERERLERLSAQLDALLRDSSAAEPSPSELAALDTDLSNKFPSVLMHSMLADRQVILLFMYSTVIYSSSE